MDATPSKAGTCTDGGCERRHYARGLCERHYQRLRASADFSPLQRPTSQERFWAKVDSSGGAESCWEWTASRNAAEYGKFWWNGRKGYAHRAAYEFAKGPIGLGQQVDHLCYNHSCCNPAHLRLVTHKQNQENRRGAQRNNATSGIRGVVGRPGRWFGQIRHNCQQIKIGPFATIEEAAEAVRLRRLELFTHNDADRKAG